MKKRLKKSIATRPTGFTLLEIITAVAIFSILIVSATSIFQMAIEGQRSVSASENMQANLRYMFEVINREFRYAQKTLTSCDTIAQEASGDPTLVALNRTFNTNGDGDLVYFKNIDGACTVYFLVDNRIKIRRGADEAFITPPEFKVNRLKFYVDDDAVDADPKTKQPRVTLSIQAEISGKRMHSQKMDMETTISNVWYGE